MTKSERYTENLRLVYPRGTRIRLIEMVDDPEPVPPGTLGTVTYVDDANQIHMHWDNNRTLPVVSGVDRFEKL